VVLVVADGAIARLVAALEEEECCCEGKECAGDEAEDRYGQPYES